MGLDGVWGSIFSFHKGRFLWKLPRRFPYPITVNYGQTLPPTATPFQVRSAVQELLVEAWQARKARMRPLPIAFINTARNHPLRFAMADAQNPRVSFGAALVRSIFLARRLRKIWPGQTMAGVLLPPSVPGALVNHAALLLGKVPVNLNYTVSAGNPRLVHPAMRPQNRRHRESVSGEAQAQIALRNCFSKISSALRFGVPALAGPGLKAELQTVQNQPVWNLAPGHRREARRVAHRVARAGPLVAAMAGRGKKNPPGRSGHRDFLQRQHRRAERRACCRHYNIGSNIEQLEQVFGLNHHDGFLGILPFFHSFGFTGTLCLPAMLGVGMVYHPNPLDAKAIGPLVREHRLTFLLATPTFLQLYLRSCAPADFGSLRVVMTAAEKLPDRLASAFEEHFGIRPLEGYGCTECAPAVAVNTHDFRSAGFRQIGAKRGKIGHPLPGVSVRIVSPENPWSGENLPAGQPGLMLVSGPNVMQGYLGQPEKTAEVLRDGWYVTGDIAAIDEDGFLQITDRLSRFSKIGGEMVPHIKVEEKLHELANATEQTFVVTGLPDEKKGERLVVLHKLPDAGLASCLEKLAQCDLPNLWKPRADQFFRVDNFPLLGTGKLDLRQGARTGGPVRRGNELTQRRRAPQSFAGKTKKLCAASRPRRLCVEIRNSEDKCSSFPPPPSAFKKSVPSPPCAVKPFACPARAPCPACPCSCRNGWCASWSGWSRACFIPCACAGGKISRAAAACCSSATTFPLWTGCC